MPELPEVETTIRGLYLIQKQKIVNLKIHTKQLRFNIPNDIIKILGEPSTKSSFDNDVWIYIERKFSTGKIYKLGRNKTIVNNVLVLEIDEVGLLANKKLYKKEDMKDLKFAENSTDPVYRKRSFVYDFLSSMRQKINDPLGKRKKK